IGCIDFTGDMPILLGPDGPSLGGFVCPGVVCDAELWKLGQLCAGDRVRFVVLTRERAAELEREQAELLRAPSAPAPTLPEAGASARPGTESRAPATTQATLPDGAVLREFGA